MVVLAEMRCDVFKSMKSSVYLLCSVVIVLVFHDCGK